MWEAWLLVSQRDIYFDSFKGLLGIYWKHGGYIPPWRCLATHLRLLCRFRKLATRLKLFPRKRKQHGNLKKIGFNCQQSCTLLSSSKAAHSPMNLNLKAHGSGVSMIWKSAGGFITRGSVFIEAASQFGTKAKAPRSGSLLYLSWNVCRGMQDALRRNGGQLLNPLGICWVIGWARLTHYPVVLSKQGDCAGRLTEHAVPLVPTLSGLWWDHYNIIPCLT